MVGSGAGVAHLGKRVELRYDPENMASLSVYLELDALTPEPPA